MGWNQMILNAKRIFMNEADGSPGNAAPAAAAVSAEPTAAPTAPLDVDTLMTRLSGVIDEKLSAHQNAINAGLRKAGTFKQDKPTDTAQPQPTTSAPAVAQAGPSLADVDARMDARIELERVISTREGKYGLTESQARRLRASLSGVSRDSLASEADSYLADMGLAKAPTQPATPAQATAAPAAAKPNISDRGTAAPTDMRDSEGVLNSRPLEMTAHDLDALKLKHGEAKALQMFAERVNAALRGIRIAPPGGRQR
jgi:hypothetical protein